MVCGNTVNPWVITLLLQPSQPAELINLTGYGPSPRTTTASRKSRNQEQYQWTDRRRCDGVEEESSKSRHEDTRRGKITNFKEEEREESSNGMLVRTLRRQLRRSVGINGEVETEKLIENNWSPKCRRQERELGRAVVQGIGVKTDGSGFDSHKSQDVGKSDF